MYVSVSVVPVAEPAAFVTAGLSVVGIVGFATDAESAAASLPIYPDWIGSVCMNMLHKTNPCDRSYPHFRLF